MLSVLLVTVVICIVFTVLEVVLAKKKPVAGLHNLPHDIQERVQNLPEYRGKVKILTHRERIMKKVPALVLLLFIFAAFVHFIGADSFFEGFGYTFVMWMVIKIYVTLVLMCGWYAHTPEAWIKGTEDMQSSYQNYGFYLSSVPRSLLAGAIVATVIGIMMELV